MSISNGNSMTLAQELAYQKLSEVDRSWLDRGKSVTPGSAQTNSKQHGRVGPFSYPAFAVSGDGAWLNFLDGSRAIDLAGSNGAAALGYARPEVTRNVMNYSTGGCTLSLPTTLEIEASELMTEAFTRGLRRGQH